MSGSEAATEEAARWLRYAQEDLRAAMTLLGHISIAPRHVCWLAQQAAEKALKAALIFLQVDFPKRHDLEALTHLLPAEWQVTKHSLDLASLTEWAVEARYPGDWPEANDGDARSAVERAQSVVTLIEDDLRRRGLHVA